MIAFLAAFLRLFFLALGSKRNVLSKNALLKKGNDILLRRVGKKRVHFNIYDKLFFVVRNRATDSAIGRDSKSGAGSVVQTRKFLLLR
jgi:hypothetical protein